MRFAFGLMAVGILFLAACASHPEPITLVYSSGREPVSTPTPAAHVVAFAIEDCRDSQSRTLGELNLKRFESTNIPEWVASALCAETSSDLKLQPLADAPNAEYRVVIRLRKIYIHGLADTKSAAIVADAEFFHGNTSLRTITRRGMSASMNWFGSNDEALAALNRALGDCMRDILANLRQTISST